jgi:Tfp pilus assembly protein PilE
MKSQKGVTLISLIIYIIVMAIVVAVMATISKYFYTNTSKANNDINAIAEFTKFNNYFTEEINHEGIKVLKCETTDEDKYESYIVFSNGVQYSFISANEGVYRDKAKICSGVTKCKFSYEVIEGKDIVKVEFQAGENLQEISYTLND